MKNYWLDRKNISGPLCVAISCSKDEVPGACIFDLENCKTLDECLQKAIHRSKELTVIGKADKIVLMSTSQNVIWHIPGLDNIRRHEKENTIFVWEKIEEVWKSVQMGN